MISIIFENVFMSFYRWILIKGFELLSLGISVCTPFYSCLKFGRVARSDRVSNFLSEISGDLSLLACQNVSFLFIDRHCLSGWIDLNVCGSFQVWIGHWSVLKECVLWKKYAAEYDCMKVILKSVLTCWNLCVYDYFQLIGFTFSTYR